MSMPKLRNYNWLQAICTKNFEMIQFDKLCSKACTDKSPAIVWPYCNVIHTVIVSNGNRLVIAMENVKIAKFIVGTVFWWCELNKDFTWWSVRLYCKYFYICYNIITIILYIVLYNFVDKAMSCDILVVMFRFYELLTRSQNSILLWIGNQFICCI